MDAADLLNRQLDSSLNARGHRGVFKAVPSLHGVENTQDLRNTFCRDVSFFASAEAAAGWLRLCPDGWVLPIADAHALACRLARKLEDGLEPT